MKSQAKQLIKKAKQEILRVPDVPTNQWADEEIKKRFSELPETQQTEVNKAKLTREVSSFPFQLISEGFFGAEETY